MATRERQPAAPIAWPVDLASAPATPASQQAARRRATRELKRGAGQWLFWLATGLIVVWSVGPFAWVAITSFKLDRDLATLPLILPPQPTFQHYINLFAGRPFYRYIINSAIVSTGTTIVCLLLGTLGG